MQRFSHAYDAMNLAQKKLKTFKVTSGDQTRRISLPGNGVLTFHIMCTEGTQAEKKEVISTGLGGVDVDKDTQVRWEPIDVALGTLISIEVQEHDDGDPYSSEEPIRCEMDLEKEKEYVRDKAKQFGWGLVEDTEES